MSFCGFWVKGVQKKGGEKKSKIFPLEVFLKPVFFPKSVHFSHKTPFRMLRDSKTGFTVWVVASSVFVDIFANKHFACK